MPLPDQGFDVTEVAVPWRVLSDMGHQVVFASENGAVPAGDPRLLTGVLFGKFGAEPEPREYYARLEADLAFRAPVPWAALRMSDYDGLVLPGGHAPGMRQYLGSRLLRDKVAGFWQLERPVAAICHGVVVLARTPDPRTGRSVLADQLTTCLPKYMERSAFYVSAWRLGRYYRTYPEYVEDEVRAAAGSFERGPWVLRRRGKIDDDRPAFTVRSGRYLSARWPGDAYLFARQFADMLEQRHGPLHAS
ncbi:MAG: thiamine biosynthesis protein ThiJ [Pseudonocardiales bacterium]|nr:MAG: thiamine biosynthesis protein ThiJ [Pseudonocardiales bacterium]